MEVSTLTLLVGAGIPTLDTHLTGISMAVRGLPLPCSPLWIPPGGRASLCCLPLCRRRPPVYFKTKSMGAALKMGVARPTTGVAVLCRMGPAPQVPAAEAEPAARQHPTPTARHPSAPLYESASSATPWVPFRGREYWHRQTQCCVVPRSPPIAVLQAIVPGIRIGNRQ